MARPAVFFNAQEVRKIAEREVVYSAYAHT